MPSLQTAAPIEQSAIGHQSAIAVAAASSVIRQLPVIAFRKSSRLPASRPARTAETLITQGRVSVNGTTVTELGTKADPATDDIRVDGRRHQAAARSATSS